MLKYTSWIQGSLGFLSEIVQVNYDHEYYEKIPLHLNCIIAIEWTIDREQLLK